MNEEERETFKATLLEIYDLYRTVLLNRKYYARRLDLTKKMNLWLEICLAVGTSGTIGAWAIWKTGYGQYIWIVIAGGAAILAVIKPIVQLSKGIERYSKLYVGYSDLFYDLQEVVGDIRKSRLFTKEMSNAVKNARNRIKKLALEDDPQPRQKLLVQCYNEVNREIPPERLWIP